MAKRYIKNALLIGYSLTLLLVIGSVLYTKENNLTVLVAKMTIILCFSTCLSYYLKFWTYFRVYERLLTHKECIDSKKIIPSRDLYLIQLGSYWEKEVPESDKLWVEGRIQSCKDFWFIFNYYIGMGIMLFMSGYMSHETAKPFEQMGTLYYWLVVAISSVVFISVCVLLLRTYTYCYVIHRMKILYYGKEQNKNFT